MLIIQIHQEVYDKLKKNESPITNDGNSDNVSIGSTSFIYKSSILEKPAIMEY